MARHQLTDKGIKATKPSEKTIMLPDGEGLYLRVQPSGSKTWVYVYETHGKQRRMGLGEYPTVTLAKARELAEDARKLRADKKDPLDERERIAAEEQKAKEKAKTNTVKLLAHEWAFNDLSSRKDGGLEALRALEKDAWPVIGEMAPEDVRAVHIVQIIDQIKERKRTRTTSVVFALLRQLFCWATVRELIQRDPMYGLKKSQICAPSSPCDRAFTDAEIRFLVPRIEGETNRRALLFFLLMLATGNRPGETILADWSEVNWEKAEWLIPAAHRKGNNRNPATDHLVYLSDFALSVLVSLKALAGDNPLIFPKSTTRSMRQLFTDRQTDPATAKRGRRKLNTNLLPSGGYWTPHDIRRTVRTLLARLGVDRDVAEKYIGHVEGDKIVKTYNLYEYAVERQEAAEKLGNFLEVLLTNRTVAR